MDSMKFRSTPMRVVSLVPSWTETLIEAGVDVVGRTRFCIHPKEKAEGIPVVGGTKSFDLEKINQLRPDFIIFDKEENTKEMYEQCQWPKWSSHVCSVQNLVRDLQALAELVENKKILEWGDLLSQIKPREKLDPIGQLPGVDEWLTEFDGREFSLVRYIIWKKPWMEVSQDTFIGDVLHYLGLRGKLVTSESKYPQLSFEELSREDQIVLLSSEPFPFHKHKEDFIKFNCPVALVDGECFSWFGYRTVKFLIKNASSS